MSAVDDLAKDLSLKQLQGIKKGNIDRFESLSWVGVEEHILVKLFPHDKKYGKLHPPRTYLTSAERVREWRKIGKGDQQYKIEQAEEQQGRGAKNSSRRRRARGHSRTEEENRGDVPVDDEQQQYASPPNRVSTAKKRRVDMEEGWGGDGNEVDRLVPGGEGASSPPLLRRPTNPLELEDEEIITYQPIVNSTKCRGISTFTIDETNIKDKDKVNDGFNHLVGNVFRFKASYLSNNQCVWPYGRDVAGFIVNPNAKKNDEDDPPFTWKCIEVDDDPNKVTYAFSHRDCSGAKVVGKQLCDACEQRQYKLYELCKKEVTQREQSRKDPIVQGQHGLLYYKSPSIILPHIWAMSKQIKVLRTTVWRKEDVIRALSKKSVEISNENAGYLFNKKMLEKGYKKMKSQLQVNETEVFEILFQECITVNSKVQVQGNAKGHLYSPLLIRFAIMLRSSLSQSKYEIIRKVFGLPTNATLCEYRSADTTSEDGLMHETCRQQSIAMHKLKVPRGDFRWHLALSFDSHTVKEMLGKFCNNDVSGRIFLIYAHTLLSTQYSAITQNEL